MSQECNPEWPPRAGAGWPRSFGYDEGAQAERRVGEIRASIVVDVGVVVTARPRAALGGLRAEQDHRIGDVEPAIAGDLSPRNITPAPVWEVSRVNRLRESGARSS